MQILAQATGVTEKLARIIVRERHCLPRLARDGFRSSYAELSGAG